MAYSRWNQSRWFTFGSTPQSVPLLEQRLSVHSDCGATFDFTYEQIKNDVEDCLKVVVAECSTTETELQELKGYMQEFMADHGGEVGTPTP